jgi:transposase-like protein
MDSTKVFCPNEACPARGQVGQGNITVHDRKKRRYRCQVCKKPFSERKGTPFYRLRTAGDRHAGTQAVGPRVSGPSHCLCLWI